MTCSYRKYLFFLFCFWAQILRSTDCVCILLSYREIYIFFWHYITSALSCWQTIFALGLISSELESQFLQQRLFEKSNFCRIGQNGACLWQFCDFRVFFCHIFGNEIRIQSSKQRSWNCFKFPWVFPSCFFKFTFRCTCCFFVWWIRASCNLLFFFLATFV